jgi:dolichol-phosphate mannosyltransferase
LFSLTIQAGAVTTPAMRDAQTHSEAPVELPIPALSVVIAVHNEEGNILPLTDEIGRALAGGPSWELIYVDDASTDSTAEEIRQALTLAPAPGRMLRHAQRAGKSAALANGISRARAPWIQILDGDGQQDPADIRRVWDTMIAPGADPALGLVSGARTSRNDGAVKWLSARIANGVRRAMLRDVCRDSGCGFKLIRAEAARGLPYFSTMHRFFPALVQRAGWTVVETPVRDRPRRAGVSKYGTLDRLAVGIFDLFGVWWLVHRDRHSPIAEEIRKPGRLSSAEPAPAPSESAVYPRRSPIDAA